MILSYTQLKQRVQMRGVMSPVEDGQINGSSVDVRLGAKLLVEMRDPNVAEDELAVVSLRERTPLTFEEFDLSTGAPFLLYPGQFVLGQTMEAFNLPLDLSAEYRMKSSAARMGLSHALAVWCDPGWSGSVLTLELHNLTSAHIIELNYGDRIGQMIFHDHALVPRERSYLLRGKYNNDVTATGAKLE